MMMDSQTASSNNKSGEEKELYIFGRFHARLGQEEAVAAAILEELPHAWAERGCVAINAFRSIRDPQLFFIHSRWIDEAAFDYHAELPHTLHFLESVEPLIDHKLDVNRTRSLVEIAGRRGNLSMKYFAVTRARGPAWNPSVSMREQDRWKDHATFMDALAEEGFIVLGGPLGDGETRFLLIFNADSEKTIETRLARDPWTSMKLLQILKIEPWEILLGKKS